MLEDLSGRKSRDIERGNSPFEVQLFMVRTALSETQHETTFGTVKEVRDDGKSSGSKRQGRRRARVPMHRVPEGGKLGEGNVVALSVIRSRSRVKGALGMSDFDDCHLDGTQGNVRKQSGQQDLEGGGTHDKSGGVGRGVLTMELDLVRMKVKVGALLAVFSSTAPARLRHGQRV